MDNVLLITILTIFVAAFIGTMIRYRTRDKCLTGFSDFFVTLEMKDGKRTWGKLDVYHNGLELKYPSPHLDPDGDHFETSYIVYQNQYGNIFALKRLQDELSPENQKKREKEIKTTYHPNAFRRFGRNLRNAFNLLRDAFGQAISVFIGQVKKAGASTFVSTQDAKIQDTAKTLLGASAAAYEPMLENYIGRKVVLEVMHDGKKHEFCGILKDYTDSFITLLDVPITEEHEFSLSNPTQLEINQNLDFEVSSDQSKARENAVDLHIRVNNHGKESIHICHAEGNEFTQLVDAEVESGKEIAFDLTGVPLPTAEGATAPGQQPADDQPEDTAAAEQNALPDLRLWIRAHRYMDVVVPRTHGFVRHGAESIGQLNIKFFLRLKTP